MKRGKCVLCGYQLNEIFKINDMPSFMGVVDSNNNIIKNDMIIGECDGCGLLQNINLLDPEVVYMNNHNTEVVGKIWEEHYIEFCNFIKNNSVGDIVLEIGDPSAKLAIPLKNYYDKWIIVEPNTDMESFDNIEIVKGFFDGKNPTNDKVTTIVHSHVLEHIYDPIEFLKNCNNILSNGDATIFSIPNIRWLLENNGLPTSILHFEHTYYIDDINVELFLNKSGFELDEIYHYQNHSLFIKATKNNTHNKEIIKKDYTNNFLNLVDFYKNKIDDINMKLDGREFYLYSAHINSQFMLNNGINCNIKGLLDKSPSKIGKKLYGYDYETIDPNRIRDDISPIVVVSHMAVYYEEIKNNLLSLNKNVIIL